MRSRLRHCTARAILAKVTSDPTSAPAPCVSKRGVALRSTLPPACDARRSGLPPVPVPADNALTPAKVALGRKLFYDRRLSLNDTFSCAMCHIPEQGFTNNELATAVGIEGRSVRRNAPTVYNVAYLERLFHDGRETRLEHQVWGPLLARNEMGNPSIGAVIEKIRATPDYAGLFESAFSGRGLAMETIGMAIASYERTLVSGDSPFDRWHYGKDGAAVDEAVKRGFQLFTGKAGCSACHTVGADAAPASPTGRSTTRASATSHPWKDPGPMRMPRGTRAVPDGRPRAGGRGRASTRRATSASTRSRRTPLTAGSTGHRACATSH